MPMRRSTLEVRQSLGTTQPCYYGERLSLRTDRRNERSRAAIERLGARSTGWSGLPRWHTMAPSGTRRCIRSLTQSGRTSRFGLRRVSVRSGVAYAEAA